MRGTNNLMSWWFWLAIMTVLVLAANATAGPILDQSFDPTSGSSSSLFNALLSSSVSWSQTFTVGVAGTLAQVDLLLSASSGATQGLTLGIATTDSSGLPGSTLLGTAVIGASSVGSSPSFLSVDVSSMNANVQVGDVLALLLTTPSTVNYWWQGANSDAYSGGSALVSVLGGAYKVPSSGARDLGFKTHVEPTPEPATLALLGLGMGGLAWARRRHLRKRD